MSHALSTEKDERAPEGRKPAKAVLSEGKKAERRLGLLLCAPAVLVMAAVAGWPILYSLWLSLQRYDLKFPDRQEFVWFDNYVTVLSNSYWWNAVWITVVITVVSVVIELVLGMALALIMHRTLVGRGIVRTSTLIPYGIVTVVAAFSWRYAWTPGTGYLAELVAGGEPVLTQKIPALMVVILAEIWKTTPFMALLLMAGLALVPDDLLKAAAMDGANAWQRFTKVMVPVMKPAILVALLFRTLDAFRVFDNLFVLTGGSQGTTSVSMIAYNNLIKGLNLGIGSTMSVLIFLMVALIAFVFIKLFGTAAPGSDNGGEALMAGIGGAETASRKAWWAALNVLVVVYALFPVVWIVSLSFKTKETLADGSFIPKEWTLENYRSIFATTEFVRALVNSIGIAIIATTIAVVFGTMAAYAIARLDFPGKRVLVGISLLVSMFPQISLISPLFEIERTLGLFDTWPGLILPYITFGLPLAIYTLSAFFREIPWELEKAAKMDGATPGQAFRRVIAPLAAPGVFTTAILVFIFCWNDFLFAISLTSTENSRTVPVALSFFTGSSQFEDPTGSIAAAAVVITIPIILFVLFFQRRIVAGLTSGAVKG